MNFEHVLKRWIATDAGKQAVAEVSQVDESRRETLVAAYPEAVKEEGDVATACGAKQQAARDELAKARKAVEVTAAKLSTANSEYISASFSASQKTSRIEHELRQLLPEVASDAVSRLEAEISSLRGITDPDKGDSRRMRHLLTLRSECAGWHLLPMAELEKAINHVDAVIAGEAVRELATV